MVIISLLNYDALKHSDLCVNETTCFLMPLLNFFDFIFYFSVYSKFVTLNVFFLKLRFKRIFTFRKVKNINLR